MPRFFCEASDISECDSGYAIYIHGDDAAHITKSLRMREGERIVVCDADGFEYDSTIVSVGSEVVLRAAGKSLSENEPTYKVTVYQSLVKGDKFDTVIQKSTEIGAYEIVPVATSRCTVKLEKSEHDRKTQRWQRIAYEAAKQCGRAIIPRVRYPVTFEEAVREAAQCDLSLFCYEGSGTESIKKIMQGCASPESVSVMIGPEGGYTQDEADMALQYKINMVSLGKRILRTETASPFVLACLSCEYEL